MLEFQSTLSVRRATFARDEQTVRVQISIHALRKESDRYGRRDCPDHRNFNPRSP